MSGQRLWPVDGWTLPTNASLVFPARLLPDDVRDLTLEISADTMRFWGCPGVFTRLRGSDPLVLASDLQKMFGASVRSWRTTASGPRDR